MAIDPPTSHIDPNAERLWRRCKGNPRLRWLLDGILNARTPELGRILLLSPVELFGETQVRLGTKLSLRFRLSGFPYLSAPLRSLTHSLTKLDIGIDITTQRSREKAIKEWTTANARQARDLVVAGVLETVRRNEVMRTLAISTQAVTPVEVARQVPSYEALDWAPMENMIQLLEGFLARSRSRKALNHFTLNFTALQQHLRPEISQVKLVFRSAQHFIKLLKARRLTETAWQKLLMKLLHRGLVTPVSPMLLWCRKFPQDGFVASAAVASSGIPPFCPVCRKEAHAIAAFTPATELLELFMLKDGLLGAAVGWALKKWGIRFRHAYCVNGTEMDFVVQLQTSAGLVECKALSISVPTKQLLRNLREALKQLNKHESLLQKEGVKLRAAVCVVNLTNQHLTSLRQHSSMHLPDSRLISYERFSEWLSANVAV